MLSLQISLKIEISLFCRLFQLRDSKKNKERHRGRGRDWRDAGMSQGRQECPRLEEVGGTPWTLVSGICSPELSVL